MHVVASGAHQWHLRLVDNRYAGNVRERPGVSRDVIAEFALGEEHGRVAVLGRVTLVYAEYAAVHGFVGTAGGQMTLLEEADPKADLPNSKVRLAWKC